MNREQFLADGDVQGFLNYFSHALQGWTVQYITTYRQILHEHRNFQATGVNDALLRYAWPGSFVAPAQIQHFNFVGSQEYATYCWESNRTALNYLSAGLRAAIDADDNNPTAQWCEAILQWGMGNRWEAPYQRLLEIGAMPGNGGASQYLNHVQQLVTLETVETNNITAASVPYASSGLVKIHSLASEDGLVILDSRVAASLGECINHYLRTQGRNAIPNVLTIPRDTQAHRVPTPVVVQPYVNQPVFNRALGYRWIEAQVRVSWLLHAVLNLTPEIFPGLAMPSRAHMLEAALFMMGAQVGANHQFPNVPAID